MIGKDFVQRKHHPKVAYRHPFAVVCTDPDAYPIPKGFFVLVHVNATRSRPLPEVGIG